MLTDYEKKSIIKKIKAHNKSITILGHGSDTIVYKSDNIVIKSFILPIISRNIIKIVRDNFLKETKVLEDLSKEPTLKPYIPEYLGNLIEETDTSLDAFFFQKYEDTHTLEVELSKKIPYDRGKNIFYNLIKGFKVLHSLKYIHRDIKPANILIRKDSEIPVIIDFGLACKLPCEDITSTTGSSITINKRNSKAPLINYTGINANGTPNYLPMNMLSYSSHKTKFPIVKKNKTWKLFPSCLRSGCSRKNKKNRSISVKVTNIKIDEIFNIKRDEYALALVLDELYHSVDWKDKNEKEKAKDVIIQLKSSIIPYIAAAVSKKKKNYKEAREWEKMVADKSARGLSIKKNIKTMKTKLKTNHPLQYISESDSESDSDSDSDSE